MWSGLVGTGNAPSPGPVASGRLLQAPPVTSSLLQFRDPEYGEWFGYLNREGKVALTIKGGPFKGEWEIRQGFRGSERSVAPGPPNPPSCLCAGCFHVPRCLAMCEEMLSALLSRLA